MSELRSIVRWTGLDGNPVHNTSSTTIDAVYDGVKTYLLLRFPALRTSQAATYTCHSVVSLPELVRTATKDVVVTGKKIKCSIVIFNPRTQEHHHSVKLHIQHTNSSHVKVKMSLTRNLCEISLEASCDVVC